MAKRIPDQNSRKPGPGVCKVPIPSRTAVAQMTIESAIQKRPENCPWKSSLLFIITFPYSKLTRFHRSLNCEHHRVEGPQEQS